ncbi:MAG: transposase, partial [Deltaproteobacteria bacterium]|nr:transposase [Deltaproteobacteria bacterium]
MHRHAPALRERGREQAAARRGGLRQVPRPAARVARDRRGAPQRLLPRWRDHARVRPRQALAPAASLEERRNLPRDKRRELRDLFAVNRRLFKAYILREELDRLWSYATPEGVKNFLSGWIKALRWQRLPEMQKLAAFLLRHLDGIMA